jgi:hypothetical protein
MSFNGETSPEHHIHNSSDPLPGARGAQPAVDYSTNTMERTPSSTFDPENIDEPNTQTNFARSGSAAGQTAFNNERPMNVQPAPEGGVAVGDESDLPMGKANFGDKVIGKAQKVAGKYTKDPKLHEKGELREAGGKDAVLGNARAPHD